MRISSAVLILTCLLGGRAFAAATVCELFTAADMSAALGSTVTAAADARNADTKCTYSTPGDDIGTPYAEIELGWGEGAEGMAAAGAMTPQLGKVMDQLAGLGDQATRVGPLFMIRRGDDLISLVVSGIHDNADAVRRIYGLLDKRLPKAAAP